MIELRKHGRIMNIDIKFAILLDDGDNYYFSDDPGIAGCDLASIRNSSFEEEVTNYKNLKEL